MTVPMPGWPAGGEWPAVAEATPDGPDRFRITLAVAADNPWFDGHFPGQPVLPGIVQLHWAVGLARAAWPALGGAPRVDNLKFRQPVLPGARLTLVLERLDMAGQDAVRFTFEGEDGPCSSGRVGFE